ncbi:MAG: hypothetical protein IAE77_13830 [Prosthecobacter sp.]|uniref:hypothetical protein n=1 Tax=Prosthecobacter sp. TaxID=1965333 RepID=UPI0019ED7109|nr:hypothetical protein [Prosthecobacter sp.]MBE2284531.1 hypothetical protein [Prosthecobacter sp.]
MMKQLFPPFGQYHLHRFFQESVAEEKLLLNRMFQVVDILNQQPSDFVVSTSLYCKPHDPENYPIFPLTVEEIRKPHTSVRHGNSWWQEYMEPLLSGVERIPDPWSVRIHLAPDLIFLESYLRHPRIELRIMCHNSEFTMPGMLWRYLPLNECGVVMARGADSIWPDAGTYKHIQAMLKSDAMLIRRFRPRDRDADGLCVYRSIPGPLVIKLNNPLNFTKMAKAWLWHGMHGLLPTEVTAPFFEKPLPKLGMSHWARYGQDEQMLSHWLYYVAAAKGIYTVIDKTHQSQIWPFDQEYLESRSPHSTTVLV